MWWTSFCREQDKVQENGTERRDIYDRERMIALCRTGIVEDANGERQQGVECRGVRRNTGTDHSWPCTASPASLWRGLPLQCSQ